MASFAEDLEEGEFAEVGGRDRDGRSHRRNRAGSEGGATAWRGGNGSSDDEDAGSDGLGEIGYFNDGSAQGYGEGGARGAWRGWRLKGHYRGMGVIEALCHRSRLRWAEVGLHSSRERGPLHFYVSAVARKLTELHGSQKPSLRSLDRLRPGRRRSLKSRRQMQTSRPNSSCTLRPRLPEPPARHRTANNPPTVQILSLPLLRQTRRPDQARRPTRPSPSSLLPLQSSTLASRGRRALKTTVASRKTRSIDLSPGEGAAAAAALGALEHHLRPLRRSGCRRWTT